MSNFTFIDGIVLSQRFRPRSIKTIAGLRTLAYRAFGDIRHDGTVVEGESEGDGQADQVAECLPERLRSAWIHGSHNTKIQISSDGTLAQLKGNPGRFGRSDNVFNRDWEGTLEASNQIMRSQGLPDFQIGEPAASTQLIYSLEGQRESRPEFSGYIVIPDVGTPEYEQARQYKLPSDATPGHEGARVWSIHVTRNFVTGSESNAVGVLNWLDGQSVARVKKKRFGKSTVVWGSLKYCQVEAYLKADEMIAHCRGDIERLQMEQNPVYQWCRSQGVVRVEVKAAKDCLRDLGLTWAGDWNMEKVIQLFDARTEVLNRVKADIEEFDPSLLPSSVAMTAEAWLRGADVARSLHPRTRQRHAKILREYGIDIAEKRNVLAMPVKIKTINMEAASVPDWYSMTPQLHRVA